MAEPVLRIVADLDLQVGDARGTTTARLRTEGDELVLDAEDPARLLRAVPARTVLADLPLRAPAGLFAGQRVQVRSQGANLGRLRVTDRGGVRVRPSAAGLRVAVRALPRLPVLAAVAAAALVWWTVRR